MAQGGQRWRGSEALGEGAAATDTARRRFAQRRRDNGEDDGAATAVGPRWRYAIDDYARPVEAPRRSKGEDSVQAKFSAGL